MPRPDGPAGPSDGQESIGEPPETTPADMGGWAVDNKEKGMNDAKMLSMLTAVVDGTVRMISLSEESLRHGNPAPYLAKSSKQILEEVAEILADPEPAAAKQEAPLKQFTVVFAKGQSYVEAWYVMATDSDDARQKVPVPANSPRPLVFPGHISPL